MFSEIKDELVAGEELLWAGQPKQGIGLSSSDVFNIPMIIICFLAVIFEVKTNEYLFEYGYFGEEALELYVGFSVGVFFLLYRQVIKPWWRKRVFYAVTNRRAIIVNRFRTRSFPMDDTFSVAADHHFDKLSTIYFTKTKRGFMKAIDPFIRRAEDENPPAFKEIENGRAVYGLLIKKMNFKDSR